MVLKYHWIKIEGIDEIPKPIRDHQGYNGENWYVESALILSNQKAVRLRFDNGICHLWKLLDNEWVLTDVTNVPAM